MLAAVAGSAVKDGRLVSQVARMAGASWRSVDAAVERHVAFVADPKAAPLFAAFRAAPLGRLDPGAMAAAQEFWHTDTSPSPQSSDVIIIARERLADGKSRCATALRRSPAEHFVCTDQCARAGWGTGLHARAHGAL